MGHVFEDLHNKIDMFTRQETKKKAVVSGLLFFTGEDRRPFDPNLILSLPKPLFRFFCGYCCLVVVCD